jgi:hypothetical protein
VKRSFPRDTEGRDQLNYRCLPFRSKVLEIALIALCWTTGVAGATTRDQSSVTMSLPSCPTLTPDDRIIIFAPHPDDESIACGGVIQQALALKVPVRIVWLTYGDNNEWSFSATRRPWPPLKSSAWTRINSSSSATLISAP